MIKNKFKRSKSVIKKIRKRFYIKNLAFRDNKYVLCVHRTTKHLYATLSRSGQHINHINTVQMIKSNKDKYISRSSCINDMADKYYDKNNTILSDPKNYIVDTCGMQYKGVIKLFIDTIYIKSQTK